MRLFHLKDMATLAVCFISNSLKWWCNSNIEDGQQTNTDSEVTILNGGMPIPSQNEKGALTTPEVTTTEDA